MGVESFQMRTSHDYHESYSVTGLQGYSVTMLLCYYVTMLL